MTSELPNGDRGKKGIPEPTLRRLPLYHHLLLQHLADGLDTISCSQIAEALKLDATQIRKDLAVTGIKGRPKVGYDLAALIEAVETFLGWNNIRKGFLVGAGNLGSALLGYSRFHRYGLDIVAAFDRHPDVIGRVIHGREVLHVSKLPHLARRMRVHVGIITVPADAAQEVANLMVSGGIRAIWNFAPTPVDVPEGVLVQREDLYSSLGVLLQRLNAVLDPLEHR